MKILFIQVGKTTDEHLISLCASYAARVSHYVPFTLETVPDLKNTKSLSQLQQKEREAEGIIRLLQPRDYIVLLDERGEERRSVEFAKWLNGKMVAGCQRLVFIIGGPYGFSEEIYQRASEKISLSKLTFSHQMVRLFFLEQLYRAFTIIRGEPYHHE